MGVTNKDRKFARDLAQRIFDSKKGRAHLDFHIAKNISYLETLYRGILTECAFANEFGGRVDTELRQYGDGGRDFEISFEDQPVIVNVKSKSVRSSFAGMVRVGTHLRVAVRECRPETIYVFGVYYEQTDSAEVFRWQWGKVLIDLDEVRIFENGDVPAYTQIFEDLRDIRELKEAAGILLPFGFKPPPFGGYCEDCGAPGLYVMRAAEKWLWFCNDHRKI